MNTLGCILLCTSHSLDILLVIYNTRGHIWMHSSLYLTWVEHSVVDLQYLWTPLNAFCSVLHRGWTFCCWSAILVDTLGCILFCTSQGLDILLILLIYIISGYSWLHSVYKSIKIFSLLRASLVLITGQIIPTGNSITYTIHYLEPLLDVHTSRKLLILLFTTHAIG